MKINLVFLLLLPVVLGCQYVKQPKCSQRPDSLSYHPHETSCSLYYRCENGHINTFNCFNGELFNENIGACDLAENVVCNRCREHKHHAESHFQHKLLLEELLLCPTEPVACDPGSWGTMIPDATNCSAYYYCDMFDLPILRVCAPGDHFSPTELRCMPEVTANCTVCVEVTTTTPEPTTTVVTTAPPPEICAPIAECLPHEVGFFKPYSPDCNKYIYCGMEGYSQVRSCPNFPIQLKFSPNLLICTTPAEAECKDCIVPPDPCSPPICSTELWGNMYPHESDCGSYYYCNEFGDVTVRVCPDGEEFSSILNRCTAAEIANCVPCDATTLLPTSTLEPCPMPTCSEWGQVFPHPTDCGAYVYCDALSSPIIRYCPTSYEYSPSLQHCVPKNESDCTQCFITTTLPPITSTTEEPICPLPTCTLEEWGVSKPHPTDCSSYIYCNPDGSIAIRGCPPGLHFNEDTQSCADPEIAQCVPGCDVSTTTEVTTTTEVPEECPLPKCRWFEWGAVKPHSTNCNLYIYCKLFGAFETRSCPSGLHFSPTTQSCVAPSEANCIPCGSTTPNPCPIPECYAGDEGSLKRHPSDCQKYIYCNEELESVVSQCLFGMHFNFESQTCSSPLSANCQLCGVTTTTTTTQPPTTTTTTTLPPTTTTTTTPPPTTTTTTTPPPTTTTTTTKPPTTTTTTTPPPTTTTTTTKPPTTTTTTTPPPTSTTTICTPKPTYPAEPDPYIKNII